ncbi:DUF2252 domain-containing protein [Limosilactobacillus antri]|uniref:DUF2252 domain-containing protein n=1 Tax=Limosilactobacillus antri TaxID=227943 RepID=UPI001F57C77F|nr:DUF2252 domain-containing protein [Limosilactobacillus antri]
MTTPSLDIFDLKQLQLHQSKQELEQTGRKLQQETSSQDLSTFVPVKRDPVAAIMMTESKMIPELLPLRHERMIASPFSFFRGTAELMERDLKEQHQSNIPIVISGDAHVNNFGFYASPERQLLFGLNDFDESRIGNWESDLKRLLVSAELVGEENGFDRTALKELLELTTKTYRHAIKRANRMTLSETFYSSFEINDMVNTINALGDGNSEMNYRLEKIMKKSQHSNSEEIVQKMGTTNEHGQLVFKDNPPRAKHLGPLLYQQVVAGYNFYRQNAREDVRVFLANFHISDIIRYSVGVGSFGTRCYLIMLTGLDGSHIVLQVKEALPLRYNLLSLQVQEAIHNGIRAGRRIVTAQRVLQSSSDPFLASTRFGGRSYYVRQFRDMKESINVSKLDLDSFQLYCQVCALLLAMAHSQSPTSPLIRGYLKHQKVLDEGLADWSLQYVNQVRRDYQAFKQALHPHQQK